MDTGDLESISASIRDALRFERDRILFTVRCLWTRGEERLDSAIAELNVDLEVFAEDPGEQQEFFVDDYQLMAAWLRDSGFPWSEVSREQEIWEVRAGALFGLSEQELYLVLARSRLDMVRYLLSPEAQQHWSLPDALRQTVICLVCCERALAYAERLCMHLPV